MPILTIASLTLHEVTRRRLVLAVAVLSLVLIALTGWGSDRLYHSLAERNGGHPSSLAVGATFSGITLFLAFMFSNVLAVGAAFLAAPSIASDLESGLLLAILPRPLRRAELVLGKWLGLTGIVTIYTFAVGGLELGVIAALTGYAPPHPVYALLFLIAESVVMLTLALLFSTRLAPITGGIAALGLFGFAWIAGITATIAGALGNEAVVHGASIVNLVLPSDGLWRGAVWALEPVALAMTAGSAEALNRGGPFVVAGPPPAAFLAWSTLWLIAVLGAAIHSFRLRDV